MNILQQDLGRLRYNVLSETLSDIQFEGIKDKFVEKRFRANEVILEDEAEGEELYLIVEGRVRVTKNTKDGKENRLALLHSGDFFGELELVDGRPRAARVVAVEDCVTYAFHKTHFEKLLRESHPFTRRLLQVLSVRLRTLNNHFVHELERSTQRAKEELGKLQQLIEAAKNLNSTLDLDKLLTVILETALKIVDGDRGTVYLLDEQKQELWSRVLKGDELIEIRLPMGKGIAGFVAATGDTMNIADAYYDPRFNPEIDRMSGYRTETILCMPMKNKDGKIIGVFQLLNKHNGTFTGEDEDFIAALSVHAAIAVENARLYEAERLKITMEKDLLAAREVQMALIPKALPPAPGFDLAARTIPAREVGGDLYDFVPMEEGKLAVCLGDVSGKGLPASLLMANLQAVLRNQAQLNSSPSECLRHANAILYSCTTSEKFVTLFYGVLDTRTRMLTYSNAGHELPLLISRASNTGHGDPPATRLGAGGVVLGIMEDFRYEQESVPVMPGDVLVIFSDGISEAINQEKEQFGGKRVETIIRDHGRETAAALVDRIIDAVRAHSGGTPQMDDITLVVIKGLPA